MRSTSSKPLVTTIKYKCRTCYTCVRECPAKAIRISDGQAEVIPERCIGCGNCVKVCSQNAKQVHSSIPNVRQILKSKDKVVAIVAPSFPAEFFDSNYRKILGKIKSLGFDYINEVGFGAELVARKMKELLEKSDKKYIATTCPSVFGYIKRYNPELLSNLAPVVSPMIATARVLKKIHGNQLKVIFIGPCISKKGEAYADEVKGDIDDVLTFYELKKMFELFPENLEHPEVEFDLPLAGKGNLFPIRRGMLATAEIEEDLISGDVVSANGKEHFIDAVQEFAAGSLDAKLLEVLCCDGCIMGAGMTTKEPLYKRRTRISKYVRAVSKQRDDKKLQENINLYKDIDISRVFYDDNQKVINPDEKTLSDILSKMGKLQKGDELNCGACGYESCRKHALAIYKGLAEPQMCLPYVIDKLNVTIKELNISDEKLDDTRTALIQAEKLASMGQLAAGIAHEVNNPLGTVIMYSNLLKESNTIDTETHEDLEMIVSEANRCKKIVSGLLDFARKNKVNVKNVNIPEMMDRFLKTIRIPEYIDVEIINNIREHPNAFIDHDQIIQVVTNLVNNSLHVMPEKGKLTITVNGDDENIKLTIADTGSGIPQKNLSKIFEPFFTTKKAGQGTGLGLSVIYGIIKMHNGDISVKSNTDAEKGPIGTCFNIRLPRNKVVNLMKT